MLYQGKWGSVDPERRAVRFQGIPGRIAAKRAILESWCYTRRNGAASILAESRPIPGGVARGSIPGRVAASCPTPVGSKRRWCYLKSFVYTRVAWWTAYTRSNQDSVYIRSLPRFCLYQVTSKILFIPGGVLLFTPASVGRRALGRPIHACRAIAI